MSCELLGCIYNDDGVCEYRNALFRCPQLEYVTTTLKNYTKTNNVRKEETK